jgi:hypothetical protein
MAPRSARTSNGALVRISTPIVGGDEFAVRSRLAGFAAGLEPALTARWPLEIPRHAQGAAEPAPPKKNHPGGK